MIIKEENGVKMEPYELLTVDVEEEHQGSVMEELGRRKGELTDMEPDGKGRVRLEYRIPAPLKRCQMMAIFSSNKMFKQICDELHK